MHIHILRHSIGDFRISFTGVSFLQFFTLHRFSCLAPPACYIDAIHHDTKNHPGDAFIRTFNTIRKNRSRDFLFSPWVPILFSTIPAFSYLDPVIREHKIYNTNINIQPSVALSRNRINKRVVHTIQYIRTSPLRIQHVRSATFKKPRSGKYDAK